MGEDRAAAIKAATYEIERAAETYDQHLESDIETLRRDLAAQNWRGAMLIAQNIAGEAAGFEWPLAGAVAAIFRDLLQCTDCDKKAAAATIALDSLALVVSTNKRGLEEGAALLRNLNAMTSKITNDQT